MLFPPISDMLGIIHYILQFFRLSFLFSPLNEEVEVLLNLFLLNIRPSGNFSK